MRALIALVVFVMPVLAAAADELAGVWSGADTAAISIYGSLKISREQIAWPPNHNYPQGCVLSYRFENEAPGTGFRNQLGEEFVTGPDNEFVTYLLSIEHENCSLQLSKLRLTFPRRNDPHILELVEYDLSGESVGWMHFTR